jgi:spore coat protein U-like protein
MPLSRPGALRRSALALAAALPGVAGAYTCSVAATALAFGVYSPFAASPSDSSGTITVTCSPNVVSLPVSYTVKLSAGNAGSFAARALASGASTLPYQLYSDAARTAVWGDGSAGTATVGGGFTLGLVFPVSATHTVYGRIPAGQSGVRAGAHADTITVTVEY